MTAEPAIAAETVIAAAQVAISAVQLGVVWYGIRRMVRANDQRTAAGEQTARRQWDIMEQQDRQAERRHVETMAALKSQGQALERQGEALAAAAAGIQNLLAARQEG